MDEKTAPVKGGPGEGENCHDCKAQPGELHQLGCDVERCRLCGGQAIACGCVFQEHDCEDESDPTEAEWAAHDARVTAAGGRLPWTGEFPGTAECREYNLPDLNSLNVWGGFVWSPARGRWVRL